MIKEEYINCGKSQISLLKIFIIILLFMILNQTEVFAAALAGYSELPEESLKIHTRATYNGLYWAGSNRTAWDDTVVLNCHVGDTISFYMYGTYNGMPYWKALKLSSSSTSITSSIATGNNVTGTYDGAQSFTYTCTATGYYWFGTGSGTNPSTATGRYGVLLAVTPAEANYQVGTDEFYDTLQKAIAGASAGETIKLLNSITDTSTATIGKNITFDTGGKTLTRSTVITISSGYTVSIIGSGTITNATTKVIHNEGNLTISDATLKSTTNNGRAIENYGTVTMESGTLTSPYLTLYNRAGGTFDIRGGSLIAGQGTDCLKRVIYLEDNSTLKMSGGTMTAEVTTSGTTNSAYTIVGMGDVEISGTAEVIAKGYTAYAINLEYGSAAFSSSINISETPTITATATDGYGIGVRVAGNSSNATTISVPVTISGGTITATANTESKARGANIHQSAGAITITGGTITADGYGIQFSNTGTATIGDKDAKLSIVNPSISGGIYAVNETTNGTFIFNNGILKGTTEKPYYGTENITRGSEYVLQIDGPDSSGIYSAYLIGDVTPPVIASFSLSAIATNQATFTASANVTDTETGIASVTFIVYMGADTIGTYSSKIAGTASNDTYTATVTFANVLNTTTGSNSGGANGVYRVFVRAVDDMGNSIDSEEKTIIYDTFAPTNGSVKINNDAEYTNSSIVTLTLYAEDATSGVAQVAISNRETGGTSEAYSTTKEWSLADGEGVRSVYIVYKDAAGNTTVIL